jgi:hypothetical protein
VVAVLLGLDPVVLVRLVGDDEGVDRGEDGSEIAGVDGLDVPLECGPSTHTMTTVNTTTAADAATAVMTSRRGRGGRYGVRGLIASRSGPG